MRAHKVLSQANRSVSCVTSLRTLRIQRHASSSSSSSHSSSSSSSSSSSQQRCSTCQNVHCSPGPHCSLGWTSTSASKSSQFPITAENHNDMFALANRVMVGTYAKPPIIFTSGKGVYMYDSNGNKYLDFTAGIAVNALGHSDPGWVEAVIKQARKIAHTSNLYHTEPAILLARDIVANSQFDRVFFSNSGTEANEAALKFARKWARHTFPAKAGETFSKTEYVAFKHGFSGRSMGSLSLTHKEKYRLPFMPLIPGVSFAEYNNIASAESVINEKTCAVVVEPVQGEGGVTPADPKFLRSLRALCDKFNVLLIVDEVQCGLGRTGRLWAHEAYGIKPDMMTLAKPLAGGLPIGACVVTEKVSQAIGVGEHGSTFAGGPLVCAVAQSVFERISAPDFLASVRSKGEYMVERLSKLPHGGRIKEIRHAGGLFAGVEFHVPVKGLVAEAQDRGVLFVNAGEHVLRMCPPLIAEKQHIDQAIDLLQELIPKMEAAPQK